MRKINRIYIWMSIACCLLVTLAGCINLTKEYPDIKKYTLNVEREAAPAPNAGAVNLKVMRFDIASEYESIYFTYKTGDLTIEYDFYNRFAIDPATMITEQVIKWAGHSPFVRYVESKRSIIMPEYAVKGDIIRLYADLGDEGNAKAVLEIRFVILDNRAFPPHIIFQNVYSEEIMLRTMTIMKLVEGWNTALRNILVDFEADLTTFLKSSAKKSETKKNTEG